MRRAARLRREAGAGRHGWLSILVALLVVAGGGALGFRAWGAGLMARTEGAVRQALLASVDSAGELQVEMQARPWPGLLSGRIDRLRIWGRGLRAGPVTADRFSLEGDDVQVDTRAMLAERRLAVRSARRLDMEVVLSEAAINSYIQATNSLYGSLLQVTLQPDGARFLLEAQVSGQAVRISLDSRVGVEAGNILTFTPDRLAIERDGDQAMALELAGTGSEVRVELGELPVPITIDRVETGVGELHLFGRYARTTP